MKGVDLLRRHLAFQQIVGPLCRHLRADEPQATRDPVDVGVHGHRRHPEGEAQHYRRGLGTHARQRLQPGLGLGQRKLPQEVQVQLPAELQDAAQRALDARCLLTGQP